MGVKLLTYKVRFGKTKDCPVFRRGADGRGGRSRKTTQPFFLLFIGGVPERSEGEVVIINNERNNPGVVALAQN